MKKYNLLVVGNGFDLNLGHKTSCINFCEDFRFSNQPINNKLTDFFSRALDFGYMLNNNWTGFERVLCQYLEFLNFIFTSPIVKYECRSVDNVYYESFIASLTISNINETPLNCRRILDISNPLEGAVNYYWFDVNNVKYHMDCRISSIPATISKLCIEIKKRFIKEPSKYEVRDYLIEEFNKLLEDTENSLLQYIKCSTSEIKQLSTFISNNIGDEVDFLLTFNYSKTSETIFKLTPPYVAHVHGSIDDEIVLGIENDMIEGQTISENSPYYIFFKRARRFIKRCNEGFSEKILDKINSETKIAVFGHSLDKSDKLIFKSLLCTDFKSCDIYYYGEEKSYRAKLINLIGIDATNKLSNDGKIKFIKIT